MKRTIIFVFLFGIVGPVGAEPHAFPVPYVESRAANSEIYFSELPGEGTIKIFTITGDQVVSLPVAPGMLSRPWDLKNSNGKRVATGVYFFIVEGGGQKTKGKLIVIR